VNYARAPCVRRQGVFEGAWGCHFPADNPPDAGGLAQAVVPWAVQALGSVYVHHPLEEGRTIMATSAERTKGLRKRERRAAFREHPTVTQGQAAYAHTNNTA
jgi:hypothetical protein